MKAIRGRDVDAADVIIGQQFDTRIPVAGRGNLGFRTFRKDGTVNWNMALETGGVMIRFIFRFFGLLFLAFAFIFLVYDGTNFFTYINTRNPATFDVEIVLSATYRQSSDSDQAKAAIDAANEHFWRMHRRRLTIHHRSYRRLGPVRPAYPAIPEGAPAALR